MQVKGDCRSRFVSCKMRMRAKRGQVWCLGAWTGDAVARSWALGNPERVLGQFPSIQYP